MSVSGLTRELAIDIRTARRDAAAMEAAFDRCSRALYRYIAVRVGDAHLADDMMQQLWLQARTNGTVVAERELEFWLRGIARNLVRSHWRRQKRRPKHVPLADASLAAELSERLASEELPAETLERQEVRDQLLLAITELSSDEQELVVGHYFEGRSLVELGRMMGLGPRAIEGRLYRARQMLRRKLENLA